MVRIVRYATEDGPRYGTVEGTDVAVIEPHPFGPFEPTGETVPLEGLHLLAPVIPSKIVCVGRNYAAHAAELGGDVPPEPLLFLKPSSAVIGPGEAIRYPTGMTEEVHHEAEVAVVVGRLLQRASPADCREGILGVTAGNDVTARDLQRQDDQWTRAKGFDSFCPLGPAIATGLELDDIGVRGSVNGRVRQDGSTRDMVTGIPELLSYISQIMTLLPTDVVLTGTPEGVGAIVPGDTVAVEVDGVGALENDVVDRDADRTARVPPGGGTAEAEGP